MHELFHSLFSLRLFLFSYQWFFLGCSLAWKNWAVFWVGVSKQVVHKDWCIKQLLLTRVILEILASIQFHASPLEQDTSINLVLGRFASFNHLLDLFGSHTLGSLRNWRSSICQLTVLDCVSTEMCDWCPLTPRWLQSVEELADTLKFDYFLHVDLRLELLFGYREFIEAPASTWIPVILIIIPTHDTTA